MYKRQVHLGKIPEEAVDHFRQDLFIDKVFHLASAGNTVLQLCQRRVHLAAAPLLGAGSLMPVQRQIAGDLPQIGRQLGRPLRRNRVPRPQPRIVDTFLRVLTAVQNIVRNMVAVLTLSLIHIFRRAAACRGRR